ncbi:TonB-dependent receptor plug domain-containing protein, partial [Picosynechococcus sp. PCC 7002]|uniref:TonB-dependent receptor plug domain-containing protein n=3 Tax=Cyanobacteriota TaxID=1117 RepID=UPI0030DD1EF7
MKQQARDSFALAVGSMMPVLIATQPAQAQTSAITGIEIIETLTGAEVFLQTTTAQLLEISTTQSDNTLITEVTNAQLRLPEGQPLQSTSFSNTIESVEVLQATENSVQIQITGMDALPEISTDLTIDGLFLRAQGSESNWVTDDGTETLELVVTATRTPEDPEDISRSVTIITRDQIATQAALNQNLGDILGQLVPGFGPTSDRAFTAASLRGRTASILVDGVPLNVNNRDFDRELKTIAPNAIERIEVVRGPSALYGGEATGGIINIITRRAGEERLVTQVELGVDAALGNFEGESFGNFLRYGLSGQENNVDYLVDLSRTSSGAIFDAEGDRIPVIQGNDESETFNILGKVGIALGEQQRLQFSANHYNSKRTTDVISDPIVDAIPGVQKAQALEVGELQFPAGGGPQTDRNTVFNVSYNHADLWG